MSYPTPRSVFADIRDRVFKHRYRVTVHVADLVGGIPTDQNVAEGWIRTKMGESSEELIREQVEEIVASRGVTADVAKEEAARNRHLTGFRRDFGTEMARADQLKATTTGVVFEGKRKIFTPEEARRTFGQLYFEGRQVKAMLKEAAMISGAADHVSMKSWGRTNKALKSFLAEHLFVEEDRIYMDRTEPDAIVQSFVHTWRGSGIKLEEHVYGVDLTFTLVCDYPFDAEDRDFFGKLFVAGEMNGVGASRSQGYGRFVVTEFTPFKPEDTAHAARRAPAKRAAPLASAA